MASGLETGVEQDASGTSRTRDRSLVMGMVGLYRPLKLMRKAWPPTICEMTRLLPLTCAALLVPLLTESVCGQGKQARPPEVRGITISTHGSGRDWGTDRIVAAFKAVKAVGATWVCLHPYGWIRRDGTVSYREFPDEKPPAHLVRPIKEARALGLKILVKPHIGYWGSGWRWRGDIAFKTEEEWRRFFSTYEKWIVRFAGVCKEADGFVVGTELDRTTGHEKEWRRIIGRVRRATKAPLTYAANWSHYQEVRFWDALDHVGIQAYFPLAKNGSAPADEIKRGWAGRMKECREFSRTVKRKILFTELGYNRSFSAPVTPWDYATDGAEAEGVQRRCLRIALEAVRDEPCVIGSFLWKWFPPPRPVGRNFQLATPALKKVIKGVWSK
jgi:hypothetical protein